MVYRFGLISESNFPHQLLHYKTQQKCDYEVITTATSTINSSLLLLGRKPDLPLYLILHVYLSYQRGRNSRDLPGSQETLDTAPTPEDGQIINQILLPTPAENKCGFLH